MLFPCSQISSQLSKEFDNIGWIEFYWMHEYVQPKDVTTIGLPILGVCIFMCPGNSELLDYKGEQPQVLCKVLNKYDNMQSKGWTPTLRVYIIIYMRHSLEHVSIPIL